MCAKFPSIVFWKLETEYIAENINCSVFRVYLWGVEKKNGGRQDMWLILHVVPFQIEQDNIKFEDDWGIVVWYKLTCIMNVLGIKKNSIWLGGLRSDRTQEFESEDLQPVAYLFCDQITGMKSYDYLNYLYS